MSNRVQIGLTGISFQPFWGFTQDQYRKRIPRMHRLAERLGADITATPDTFTDAAGARAAARRMNKADLAVLDVATYPEGKAALAFFDALTVPLVLWSRDESVHGTHIGHNSFCGANFLAGLLALRGTRFRAIHGEPTSASVAARLRTAVRLIAAAKACAGSIIGLFGEGVVPKFYDIDISKKDRDALRRRYNIQFVGVPVRDLVSRAERYADRVITPAAEALDRRFPRRSVDKTVLVRQARLVQAIQDFSHEGRFASLAIRCWPELQTLFGAWPCPAISVLNDLGLPAACEGDPGGALDMLLASRLSSRPTTLLDVVDWDVRNNRVALWHCGPTACSWADGIPRLRPHNNDGRTPAGRPAAGLPAIVDMDFAPGPVTVFRSLGALDDEFAFEGRIVRAPHRRICGSFGMVGDLRTYGQPTQAAWLRDLILTRALPHHYTAARGHLFTARTRTR